MLLLAGACRLVPRHVTTNRRLRDTHYNNPRKSIPSVAGHKATGPRAPNYTRSPNGKPPNNHRDTKRKTTTKRKRQTKTQAQGTRTETSLLDAFHERLPVYEQLAVTALGSLAKQLGPPFILSDSSADALHAKISPRLVSRRSRTDRARRLSSQELAHTIPMRQIPTLLCSALCAPRNNLV